MINELRELVRRILILEKKADDQKGKDDDDKKNILTEPDKVEQREEGEEVKEFSGAAAVAGVTTPLGTGPTFPLKKKKRKRKNS